MRGQLSYERGGPLPAWLPPLIEGYLRSLSRRGRRPGTLRAYRFELADFGNSLLDVPGLPALLRSHVEAWQDGMVERKAPRSQMVAAAAVKGFLKWAADQELELSNAMLYLRVASPRIPHGVPRPISAQDLAAIQRALAEPDWTDLLQLRARALFSVLFSSGSRITAVLSLDRDSIRDGSAVVMQKGGGTHTLLFSVEAVQAVSDYISRRTDSHPALFVTHGARLMGPTREIASATRLGSGDANVGWKRLSAQLDIARFSSHQIRHTCGTTMLRHGVDGLVIAKHLGHRSLNHIANYAEVVFDQRRAAMAAMSA